MAWVCQFSLNLFFILKRNARYRVGLQRQVSHIFRLSVKFLIDEKSFRNTKYCLVRFKLEKFRASNFSQTKYASLALAGCSKTKYRFTHDTSLIICKFKGSINVSLNVIYC